MRRRRRRRRSIGRPASTTATTAAGPTAAADVKGDLVLASYPDWYGPDLFKDFHAKYPGATVKQATDGDGTAAQIAQLTKNKGDYDLTLAGINACEQFKLAGLLEPFDPARVPNIKGVDEFRKAYPYGVPTDFGRTGFGYRKDLIYERPTAWKELWELAAKYKGKTTMLKYDSDIQGMALIYLGYSVEHEGRRRAAGDAEGAPRAQAAPQGDHRHGLREGAHRRATSFFAINYDYDVALGAGENENIGWVQPSEGMPGLPRGLGRASKLERPPRRRDGAHRLPPGAEELRLVRQRDRHVVHRSRPPSRTSTRRSRRTRS